MSKSDSKLDYSQNRDRLKAFKLIAKELDKKNVRLKGILTGANYARWEVKTIIAQDLTFIGEDLKKVESEFMDWLTRQYLVTVSGKVEKIERKINKKPAK